MIISVFQPLPVILGVVPEEKTVILLERFFERETPLWKIPTICKITAVFIKSIGPGCEYKVGIIAPANPSIQRKLDRFDCYVSPIDIMDAQTPVFRRIDPERVNLQRVVTLAVGACVRSGKVAVKRIIVSRFILCKCIEINNRIQPLKNRRGDDDCRYRNRSGRMVYS